MQRSILSVMPGGPLHRNAKIFQHESWINLLVKILSFEYSSSCFEATNVFKYFHIYLSSTALGHIGMQFLYIPVIHFGSTTIRFMTC